MLHLQISVVLSKSGKKGERMELKAPAILPSAALSSQRHRNSGGKEKVDFHLSFPNHRQAGDQDATKEPQM